MTECFIFVKGELVRSELGFGKILELWFCDDVLPFKAVERYAVEKLGPIRVLRLGAFRPEPDLFVLEYVLETKNGQESFLIICAEDPEEALKSFEDAKSKQRIPLRGVNQGIVKLLCNTAKVNYYNVHAIKEFEYCLNEASDLLDDLMRYEVDEAHGPASQLITRSAFLFSIIYVAIPLSTGILVDLHIGNLPACFMQLRMLVETMSLALITDYHMRFSQDVFTSIDALEEKINRQQISLSKVLKDNLSRVAGEETAGLALKLWGKLSGRWLHSIGSFRVIAENFNEMEDIESFRYLLPAELDENDVLSLEELTKYLQDTRRLIKNLYKSWLGLLKDYLADS